MIVLPGAVVLKCNLVKYIFLKKHSTNPRKRTNTELHQILLGSSKFSSVGCPDEGFTKHTFKHILGGSTHSRLYFHPNLCS